MLPSARSAKVFTHQETTSWLTSSECVWGVVGLEGEHRLDVCDRRDVPPDRPLGLVDVDLRSTSAAPSTSELVAEHASCAASIFS
jgi:hypothetical protein